MKRIMSRVEADLEAHGRARWVRREALVVDDGDGDDERPAAAVDDSGGVDVHLGEETIPAA